MQSGSTLQVDTQKMHVLDVYVTLRQGIAASDIRADEEILRSICKWSLCINRTRSNRLVHSGHILVDPDALFHTANCYPDLWDMRHANTFIMQRTGSSTGANDHEERFFGDPQYCS